MTQQVITKKEKYDERYLISYSIQHMQYKDKIRFYYALKGRDGKSGMIKFTKAECLARALLILGKVDYGEFIEFLDYWKVRFISKKIFVKIS